ncbi:MAG: hypothetical protein IT371_23670 [Deltaproteobacteria bacterium]|nr:hypothetical protein [Deltaproteobacteria bacterium]
MSKIRFPRAGDLIVKPSAGRIGDHRGIPHAGKHYLNPLECWEDVVAPDGNTRLTPPALREELLRCLEKEFGSEKCLTQTPWHCPADAVFDDQLSRHSRWWQLPYLSIMGRAIDGYHACVVRAFAETTAADASWAMDVCQDSGSVVGQLTGGIILVVQPIGEKWRMVSAFRPTGGMLPPTDSGKRNQLFEERCVGRIRTRVKTGEYRLLRREALEHDDARVSDSALSAVFPSDERGTTRRAETMEPAEMEAFRRALAYTRAALETGDTDDAAFAATLLETFQRLDRSFDEASDSGVEALLEATRALLKERGSAVGQLAAHALGELPALPVGDEDPTVLRLELGEVVLAAEHQAALLPHLPAAAARAVRSRLEELEALIACEPARFAALAEAARLRLEQDDLTPLDPIWPIWSAVADAHARASRVMGPAPALDPLLATAWQGAVDKGLVTPAPTWLEQLASRLRELFAPAPLPLAAASARGALLGAGAAIGGLLGSFAGRSYLAPYTARAPGEITALLVDEEAQLGRVALLRLRHAPGSARGLWRGHDDLRAQAWAALHEAFLAASRLCPSRLPPYPLEDHELELLDAQGAPLAVDGESLGLPAALAFASLWSGTALPAGLAATGALRPSGTGGAQILPVAGVAHKAAAFAASAPASPHWLLASVVGASASPSRRLLLAASQVAEAGDLVPTEPVSTLEEALRVAGLSLATVAPPSDLGSISQRKARLREFLDHARDQELSHHQTSDGRGPWQVLADEIVLLVGSLEGEPGVDSALLDEARGAATLSYLHAGCMAEADAQVRSLAARPRPAPWLEAMLRVLELGSATDREDWPRARALSEELDRLVPQLDTGDERLALGRVYGSQGLAWLHQREPERARSLFEKALAEHAQAHPHEVGRSRLYLARAQRALGQLREAAASLELSRAELDQHTRRYSGPYYASTLMYWHYERARLHIAEALAAEAPASSATIDGAATLATAPDPSRARAAYHDALGEALEAFAFARTRGYWPALGILRILAWATSALALTPEHTQVLRTLEALMPTVPPDSLPFASRLQAEAQGPPRADGEVD